MASILLPKNLRTRLADVGKRVQHLRATRGACWVLGVLTLVAILCMTLDAFANLSIWVRCPLFLGWLALGVWAVRKRVVQPLTEPLDAEGVASIVEHEFPRLGERLMTSVELAGQNDLSNGSATFVQMIMRDAESRSQKLDFTRALPTAETKRLLLITLVVGIGLVSILRFVPSTRESAKRFFVPWYAPSTDVGFRVVVTSGNASVKRGEAINLAAMIEPTRANVTMPDSATLVVKMANREERLPMTSEESQVWFVKKSGTDAEFDYRVESGGAVSDWFHVSVIEPITLASARVKIKAPAYAIRQGMEAPPIEGLGELSALQHSTITFDLQFSRKPSLVNMEWIPDEENSSVAPKKKYTLGISEENTSTLKVPALGNGKFILTAEGEQNFRTDFPPQPLQVSVDTPPKFQSVTGLSEVVHRMRPEESITVDCVALDDVAVTQVQVEWRINQGPVEIVPIVLKNPNSTEVVGQLILNWKNQVKEDDTVYYRIVATDNRNLPEAKLTPQKTYFPANDKWGEIKIDKAAQPLKDQEIEAKREMLNRKLEEIRRELTAEQRTTYKLKNETQRQNALTPPDADRLKTVRDDVADTGRRLEELAQEIQTTPELQRLAEGVRSVADRETRDAETSLQKAKTAPQTEERTRELTKADQSLDEAIRKIEKLREMNDKLAKERLDKAHLEALAKEQKALAEQAKNADPAKVPELTQAQKDLSDRLKKIQEQSDAIRSALDAIQSEEAQKLANQAKQLADQVQDLNQAMKQTDQNTKEKKLEALAEKQDELAKKAKALADKTENATRSAQASPLKSGDAEKAKEALKNGNAQEAAQRAEAAAQELERLARDLAEAAKKSNDSREAANQLARLQEDLRQRLAQETKDTPFEKLPAERQQALKKQQDAIEKAVQKLKVPENDPAAAKAQKEASEKAQAAKKSLDDGKPSDPALNESKQALEKLAEALPTLEKRKAQTRAEVAKLRQEQDVLGKLAEPLAKGNDKNHADDPAMRRDLSKKLADAAKRQADLAERLRKLDPVDQGDRIEKAKDAMQKAIKDLADAAAQDIPASQQAAKRELDRLEQALKGETPADQKVDELAKKQKKLANDVAEAGQKRTPAQQAEMLRRQNEIAQDLERLKTPEADSLQQEATEAVRKAEAAQREPLPKDKPDPAKNDELAKKTKDAAEALSRLADKVNGREDQAEAMDRLAKKQKEVVDELAKKPKEPQTLSEGRKKAQQLAEELKNMRAGADSAAAKQKALDALQKAAQAKNADELQRLQREAAQAMEEMAERLTRNKPMPEPEKPGAEAGAAATELAKLQRELADETEKQLEKARSQPANEREKAEKEALQKSEEKQRELNKQASQLDGRDSPKDLEKAKTAMNEAEQALAKKQTAEARKKQTEAAEALERLGKQTGEEQAKRDALDKEQKNQPDELPNRLQAEEAEQLAKEQRKLRDEAMKAGEELQKDGMQDKQPAGENPAQELVKQQAEVARKAEELAKTIRDRQGEQNEASKQARQAADAAKQTAKQAGNGDFDPAKESGKQTAQALERVAQGAPGTESGEKAKGLAREQEDINQKLQEMAKNSKAAKAQQAEKQQELQQQAKDLADRLQEMAQRQPTGEKADQAATTARHASQTMENAKQQMQKGDKEAARRSREQASEALEKAGKQAEEAAKQMGQKPNSGNAESAKAGQSLKDARGQMGKAEQQLGQGKPGDAENAMKQAAESLQQAAKQLGQGNGGKPGDGQNPGEPSNSQPSTAANPTGNAGNPGGTPDLRQFTPEAAKYAGKTWGELPSDLRTKILQEMRARYGEDYARNIKLYFEQLADKK